MKIQTFPPSVRIFGATLSATILLLLVSFWATAAGPTVYWHAASTGLPSDVEALAAAPATLYAGTWGGGG